jgi:hypothetical protein
VRPAPWPPLDAGGTSHEHRAAIVAARAGLLGRKPPGQVLEPTASDEAWLAKVADFVTVAGRRAAAGLRATEPEISDPL